MTANTQLDTTYQTSTLNVHLTGNIHYGLYGRCQKIFFHPMTQLTVATTVALFDFYISQNKHALYASACFMTFAAIDMSIMNFNANSRILNKMST